MSEKMQELGFSCMYRFKQEFPEPLPGLIVQINLFDEPIFFTPYQ